MPAGFVTGDLLIGVACGSTGTVPATRPSGSTSVNNVADGTVFNLDVVRKVAVLGDVFTWTIGTAQKWAGCVIAIRLFDPATPIVGNTAVAQGATASLSFITTAATPTSADSLMIAVFGLQAANAWTCSSTTPSMTEIADVASSGTTPASCGVYVSATPPAIASINRTGTSTVSSANGCMFQVFINPGPQIPEWTQRSPSPIEQGNVAGPYAPLASPSRIFGG